MSAGHPANIFPTPPSTWMNPTESDLEKTGEESGAMEKAIAQSFEHSAHAVRQTVNY